MGGTGGGEQDGRRTRVLPGREGDHSSPRSFSEGVAALRAGLPLIIAYEYKSRLCCTPKNICDLSCEEFEENKLPEDKSQIW